MFDKNRKIVEYYSETWYHIICFASFVAAMFAFPYIQPFVAKYVTQVYIQQLLSYVVAYIAASIIFPELGCMIYKSTIKAE